jgi:MscS family membrane protein
MGYTLLAIDAHYVEGQFSVLKQHAWLLYVLAVILVATGSTYGVHILHQKLTYKWKRNEYLMLKTLMQALYWPLVIFIWIEAVSISSNFFIPYIDIAIVLGLEKIRKVSLLILLAWIFIRFVKLFEEQLLQGKFRNQTTDRNTIQITGKILRVAAFTIFSLLLLPIVGIEVTGIFAFVSSSTFILGIAARDIIANYFGGIVVHSDGHFKVGDWVHSPEKEIEGIVEYIGWRSTHIRTFDRKMLYVPNSAFSANIVVNASKMTNRRIRDVINVRYEDAPRVSKILEEVNAMLQAHPALDRTRRLALHFTGFTSFSLKLELYAFTYTIDWQEYRDIQERIFLDIVKIIIDNGAQIAIPPAVALESTQK